MTWTSPLISVAAVRSVVEGTEELHPPLLHRVRPANLQRIDLVVALILMLATFPHVFGHGGRQFGPGGGALVLAFGAALPIAIRRRAPMLALGIATAVISVATAAGQSFAPDPLIAIPVYQVASVRPRRESVTALIVAGAALLVASAVGASLHPSEGQASFSVLLALAAWFVGDSVRVRRAYSAGIAEQAAQRSREALERAQRGVVEERLRIARELHDVVAHSLSVIAVQSGVGRHVIDAQPEQARRALAAVESTSREALAELRRMLGVLRGQEGEDGKLAPAPGIGELGGLLEQIRAAGVPVDLDVSLTDADRSALSPGAELTVYRIVQEALTNVVKHAGPASARVALRREREELVVEVEDDGRGALTYPSGVGDLPGMEGGHHGIAGMRERVALFGGTLAAGPGAAGGFRVLARLPFEGLAG